MPVARHAGRARLLLVALLLAVLLPIGVNRYLWGYWLSEPSFLPTLRSASEVRGVSAYTFHGSEFVPADLTKELTSATRRRTNVNVAVPGDELLGHLASQLPRDRVPEVDASLRKQWEALLPLQWRPTPGDASFRASADAGKVYLIAFRSRTQNLFLAVRRFSEVSNDRYAYEESLFRESADGLVLVGTHHFFFDVAGIEFLDLRALVLLGTVLLALVLLVVWFRSHLRREPGVRPMGPSGVRP